MLENAKYLSPFLASVIISNGNLNFLATYSSNCFLDSPISIPVSRFTHESDKTSHVNLHEFFQHFVSPATFCVTNGAIVIHTQRLKSDPGGNLLS